MLTLVLGGLAGCGGAADPNTLTIGFTADLSGKFSANGQGLRNGFEAYVDRVNRQGGIAGKRVRLVVLDDGGDTSRGLANVTELITRYEARAIGGFLISQGCGAAEALAEANRVPLLCSSVDGDLLEPPRPYVFTGTPSQSFEARPLAEVAELLAGTDGGRAEADGLRVGLVTLASAASLRLRQELLEVGEGRGWDVALDAEVPLTATDVSAQAAQVAGRDLDVVITTLPDTLTILFRRQLGAAGDGLPVVTYDGASYQALDTLRDPDVAVLSSLSLGDDPGFDTYAAEVEDAGLGRHDPFVARGYLQGMILTEALAGCDGCAGEDLRDSLAGLTLDTDGLTAGPVAFGPADHQGVGAFHVYRWDPEADGVRAVARDLPAGTASSAAGGGR